MRLEDYPPQEPLSEAGQRYGEECWRRGEGVAAEEHGYGENPYQRLLVMQAPRPNGDVLLFWHGGGWTSGYKE
jgi:arylformamidase